MSEPQPISVRSGGGTVRAAIAHAAQRTGVDFQYLLAQAKVESRLDPNAKAPTSSAAGLYQFTNGTWLQTLDRHAASHGLDWAGAAIEGGRIRDPQLRSQIMALRFDPHASSLMAAELARDNSADLTVTLGRAPDSAELYLAHFLGSGGARQFLTALAADPGQSAAALFPKPAAANRPIFFEPGGAPRSLDGMMQLIRQKIGGEMEDAGAAWAVEDTPIPPGTFSAPPVVVGGGRIAREFHAVQQAQPAPATRSMAETLRTTFMADASDQRGNAPGFVRDAYSKLQRFGL